MTLNDPVEPPRGRWACVYRSPRFVSIESMAGYGGMVSDPKGVTYFLAADSSSAAIGRDVMRALAESRFVPPDDEPDLYDYQDIDRRFDRWIAAVIARFGLASRSQVLADLEHCGVSMRNGNIYLLPYQQNKPDGQVNSVFDWDNMDQSQTITIKDTVSPEALGDAINVALARSVVWRKAIH